MHNLLLGTAKHMISVWISLGIIYLMDVVDHFITSSDIASKDWGFSNFTAETGH